MVEAHSALFREIAPADAPPGALVLFGIMPRAQMRRKTNGMVERFNGRIEDILQSNRFRSGEDLEQTILRYVRLYNGQLPQSVLKGRTPIGALKDWHRERPELFSKAAVLSRGM